MSYKWCSSYALECSPRHSNCQDSVNIVKNNSLICACVSDGAGSAIFSEYGSKALTDTMSHYILTNFYALINLLENDELGFKEAIINESISTLSIVAEEKKCNISDLASTLILLASDGKKTFWFHIGDGVIIVCINDSYSVLSAPLNGEYANETYFVTSNNVINAAQTGLIELRKIDEVSFTLMTDGPEAIFYSRKKDAIISNSLLNYIFNYVKNQKDKEHSKKMLQYVLKNRCRTFSSDDLSIAVIVRSIITKKKKHNTVKGKHSKGKNRFGKKSNNRHKRF